MPILTAPAASPATLLDTARGRWAAVAAARPELEPALQLQHRLIAVVLDVKAAVERKGLPRLSLPPRYLAAKLARGVPVLAGEPVPLPIPVLGPALLRICEELATGEAAGPAGHIREAIETGSIDSGALAAASLARDEHAIRAGAVQRGLAPDLLWLVGELAVGPVAEALQRWIVAGRGRDAALERALGAWTAGYCGICGSWPALAEEVDGRRVLRCSFCAAAWEAAPGACAYCGERGAPFVVATPDPARPARRVEVCGTCTGYLKAVEAAALSPFPLLAVADLETMDLDVAAMERGYRRPPLKEAAANRSG